MTMTKAALIGAAKEQWAKTEAAIAVASKGNFDAAPLGGGWAAGDHFRHLIDLTHRTPELMEALVKTGAVVDYFPKVDAINAAGIESFQTLKARMLPIELNTAHGIVWMAAQKLDDATLERTVDFSGRQMVLGDLLHFLWVGHEQQHVTEAFAAAGVSA
jgi:DNA-binding Lrp family transcriptional regulator